MRALGSPVNSDYDIYNSGSGVNVYNATPDASNPRWVSFDIVVGDTGNLLDGTGGDFELLLTIGGAVFDGSAQTKTVTAGMTKIRHQTPPHLIPANALVTIKMTSPNSADTSVDVTVQPYDVGPLQPGTVAATMDVVDAAGIRAAVGLASANLDTQLSTIDDFLDTEVAAILAAVDTEVAAILTDTGTTLPAQISALFTTALTEAYRGTGATGSPAQLLYEILANLVEFANSGTTREAKKLDGSTTAKTYTYDDSVNPTSITETT